MEGGFPRDERIGAWPSGKATGFGPVILGSNPSAPANQSPVFWLSPDLRGMVRKKRGNAPLIAYDAESPMRQRRFRVESGSFQTEKSPGDLLGVHFL